MSKWLGRHEFKWDVVESHEFNQALETGNKRFPNSIWQLRTSTKYVNGTTVTVPCICWYSK